MRSFNDKKEKILDAALKVAIKNGIHDVTIREVASEAGVNIAAINYYFSSKSKMLAEMEKLFHDNFKEAFACLADKSLGAEQKLRVWLFNAISYAIHYPGIALLLRDKLNSGNETDVDFQHKLFGYVAEVQKMFCQTVGVKEGDSNLFSIFAGAVLWPILIVPMMTGQAAELDSPEKIQSYIDYIIEFFKNKNGGSK